MNEQKPNHVCKNPNCKNGVDGQPKEYWACNDCDKFHSYREVACSPECFQEYMQAVLKSRGQKINVEPVIIENETVEENVDETRETVEEEITKPTFSYKKKK